MLINDPIALNARKQALKDYAQRQAAAEYRGCPFFAVSRPASGAMSAAAVELAPALNERIFAMASASALHRQALFSACLKLLAYLHCREEEGVLAWSLDADAAGAHQLPAAWRVTAETLAQPVKSLFGAELALWKQTAALTAGLPPQTEMGGAPPQVLIGYSETRSPFEGADLSACALGIWVQASPAQTRLHMRFDAGRVDAELASLLLERLSLLLGAMAFDPGAPLAAMPWIPQAERERIDALSAQAPAWPLAWPNLAQAIAAALRDRPDATFLERGGDSVSFAQLERYSAALLSDPAWPQWQEMGDCVLIVGPKSLELALAAMACMRIGKPFCLQSHELPAEQMADIVALHGSKVALLPDDCRHWEPFFHARGCQTVVLPRWDASAAAPAPQLAQWLHMGEAASPDDALCVVMTSGSEGKPKGSVNTHRALLNLSREKRALSPAGRLRVASAANHTFDYFLLDCVEALTQDVVLVLVPDDVRVDAEKYAAFLAANRIDVAFATTVLAEELMALGDIPGLSQLYFGGESLRSHRQNNYELFNVYGPSETGVFATCLRMAVGIRQITVGKPIRGCRCVVAFPGTLEPCPIGVAGELLIGGVCVGAGYLNRPDLTAKAFIELETERLSGRFYRSGDLGCWDAGGDIEVLGRRDRQLKVNGFRVELDAVEKSLLALPGVAQAAVIGVEDRLGHARLAALVAAADDGLDERAIREALLARLPAYMVPGQIALAARLPQTRNGKLDRLQLKRLLSEAGNGAAARPLGATQTWLAACWARHLELDADAVPADKSFFALGGHSLRAARVLAELRQRFGLEVSLLEFFQHETIAALAELVDAKSAQAGGAGADAFSILLAEASAADGPGPLSAQEARLYAQYRLHPDSMAYVLAMEMPLAREVSASAARQALQALLARHDILRTRYRLDARGEPCADILPALPVERVLLDAGEDWERASARAFALDQGPLLRGCLLEMGTERARLRLQIHHILVDKPALEQLQREFAQLSRGEAPPAAELSYRGYAAALAGARRHPLWSRAQDYWQDCLNGLDFDPFGHGAALGDDRGDALRWRLPAAEQAQVKRLCAQLSVTPAVFFLALWGLAVAREGRSGDFSISVANALRPRQVQATVGMFVSLAPCAFRLGQPRGTFADYVKALADQQWRAAEQLFFPVEEVFPLLNEDPRRFGSNPLLNVAYAYAEDEEDGAGEAGLAIEAHGPLSLAVSDGGQGCGFALEYQPAVFAGERVAAIASSYRAALALALGRAPAELPLDEMLADAAAAARAFRPARRRAAYAQIDDLLLRGFAELGGRPAVIDDEGELSWDGFSALVATYAQRLNRREVRRALMVGLPGRRMQAFLAACFLTRTTYLALERGTPQARIDEVIRHAAPDLALDADDAPAPADADWRAFRSEKARADNPIAWILYSSGTTGRPKGICVAAATAAQYLDSLVDTLKLRPGMRVTQQFSPSFDGYLEEVLLAWALGGASVVADRYSLLDERRAQAFLASRRPDVISAAPALLAAWNRMEGLQPLPEVCISGGDFLAPGDIGRLLGRMRIWNSYGPTETCIAAAMVDCAAAASGPTLPIGRPFAHVAFAVLDADGRRLRPGQWGELAIYGDFERHGYLDDPALSAAKFGRDEQGSFFRTGDCAMADRDGLFYLKGRMDDSCKVRGNFIGLGELESRAGQYPGVAAAGAAVAFAGTPEACLVLAVEGEPSSLSGLRGHLAGHYARSHLPSAIFPVAGLPRTDIGKLDRARIVALFHAWRESLPAAAGQDAALDDGMRQLVACWRDCLAYQGALAADSDFFLVSGSSLSAVRLASQLEARFGVDFSPVDVFRNATVGAQWALIEARRAGGGAGAIVRERRLNADVPGTPRLLLLPPALGGLVELQALAGRLAGRVTVSALTLEHASLDALSPAELERALLEALRPHAGDLARPLWLGGYSLGAEMLAALLERQPQAAQGVARLVFLDPNLQTRVFDGPALYAGFRDFFSELGQLSGPAADEEALRAASPALHREWLHYRLQHRFLSGRTFTARALALLDGGLAATLFFSDDADGREVAALEGALDGRAAIRRVRGGHAGFFARLAAADFPGLDAGAAEARGAGTPIREGIA
ncbi:AMP-binding protein [Chromobacterium subtsugae]|uniref:AMP-binding protein n=1 Tax=Chromobacterium subtsugae TaxID=251747 RepID=UPI0007F88A72|nr:AMP-binding protein [Chromobacterium subtsugae]